MRVLTKRSMRATTGIVAIACAVLSAGSFGAPATRPSAKPSAPPITPPTTHPTTHPATKPVARAANTLEFESKHYGLKFRVPKTWKRLNLKSGDPDFFFAFQLPVTPTPANRAGAPVMKQFHVFLGLPYKGEPKLEALAAAVRDSIQKAGNGTKLREDAAVDFAGRPAWSFTCDAVQLVDVTETSGGKTNTRKEELKTVKRLIVWLQDNKMFEVGYDVGEPDFAAMEKQVGAIRDSFEWGEPAK